MQMEEHAEGNGDIFFVQLIFFLEGRFYALFERTLS